MKNKTLHKSIENIDSFLAGDHTILKEVLHPKNDAIDIPYSIAHAILKPNTSSLPHALKSTEVYYFLAGEGMIFIGEEKKIVKQGDIVAVEPNERQSVSNTGSEDLVFLCIVSPFWKADDEIIF